MNRGILIIDCNICPCFDLLPAYVEITSADEPDKRHRDKPPQIARDRFPDREHRDEPNVFPQKSCGTSPAKRQRDRFLIPMHAASALNRDDLLSV